MDNRWIVTVQSLHIDVTEPPAVPLSTIVDEIAEAGNERSARSIAAVLGRLISSGQLEAGARLPTVRALARRLGVSPTTVSDAWRTLADVGAIEARGRNGTVVRRPTGPRRPHRYQRVTEGPGHFALDLSTGTPDPDLLPAVGPIIATVSRQTLTSSYLDHPVLPELEERLHDSWPFPAEAMTVVDGAMDAIDRAAQIVLRLGDRVAVEHPAFPPLLDLLEQLGCEIVPVDVDDAGMRADHLERALARPVRAVFLQPRAHNPTGASITPDRARQLAELLVPTATLVVEDDHSSGISASPLVSLGQWLPSRTIHVRSFSKSHGPDLRLAAVGGAGDVVHAITNRRLLGPGWSSRILQAVLVAMLDDPDVVATLDVARDTYAVRRKHVTAVLADAGIDHADGDGINVWMRVTDERGALMRLAAAGIGSAPGTPFMVRHDDDRLRVTTGLIKDDDIPRVANLLAQAAGHITHHRTTR